MIIFAIRRKRSQFRARILTKLATYTPSEVKIPAIVRAGLIHGALKSDRPDENLKIVDRFLEPFEIIPFDEGASDHYAQIRSDLETKGSVIGPNDLIIAATVRAFRATLVTNNTKEFSRVENLELADWSSLSAPD